MNTVKVLEEIEKEIDILQDRIDCFHAEKSNYQSLRWDDCRIHYHMLLGMIRIAWVSGAVPADEINDLYDRVGYIYNHEDEA